MKTKNFLALFFSIAFLNFISVSAQDIVVKMSPEYKLPRGGFMSDHLHSNSSGHYIYLTQRKGREVVVILEKYDQEFKNIFSKEFESSKKNVSHLGMHYFNDKFTWLLNEQNKKSKYEEYFFAPIDMEGKSKKPISIGRFPYAKKRELTWSELEISRDTSKMMVAIISDHDSKEDKFKAFVSVFDESLEKIYSKKIKLPYSQKRTSLVSGKVANNGDAYFLVKIYDDNKAKQKKRKGKTNKPAYVHKIYKLAAEGEKAKEISLKLGNDFIKGTGINIDGDNNIACVGFLSDSYSGPIQGIFYARINGTTGEMDFADKRRFTEKEIEQFGKTNTSKDKKSKEEGLDDEYEFQDLHINDNGDMMAIAEENYSVTRYFGTGKDRRRVVYYISNSIINIKINPDGKVAGANIIPKRQDTRVELAAYHTPMVTDDNIYFLFNENKKNIDKNITDPDKIRVVSQVSGKNCVAVIAHIDENGKLERNPLFSQKDAKSLLIPKLSKQIDDSTIFYFTIRGGFFKAKKFRFGTIQKK